jgi:hypothetical protein
VEAIQGVLTRLDGRFIRYRVNFTGPPVAVVEAVNATEASWDLTGTAAGDVGSRLTRLVASVKIENPKRRFWCARDNRLSPLNN